MGRLGLRREKLRRRSSGPARESGRRRGEDWAGSADRVKERADLQAGRRRELGWSRPRAKREENGRTEPAC